jgi:hypothetical protein
VFGLVFRLDESRYLQGIQARYGCDASSGSQEWERPFFKNRISRPGRKENLLYEKIGGEAQKRAVGSRWVGMQTKDREDDGSGVYEGLHTRGNGRGCGVKENVTAVEVLAATLTEEVVAKVER